MKERFFIIICLFLSCISGCSILGGNSSIPTQPKVNEEISKIEAFERVERMGLDLSSRMIAESLDTFKNFKGAVAANGVGSSDTVLYAKKENTPTISEMENSLEKAKKSREIVEELSHVKGKPEVTLPTTVDSVDQVATLIQERGSPYKEARRLRVKKLNNWINTVVANKLGGSSSIWRTVKLILLIVFCLVGIGLYIYAKIYFGGLAKIVAIGWAGVAAVFVVYMYQTFVVYGVGALLVLGSLYLIWRALQDARDTKELVKNVQSGRSALSHVSKNKFDRATERNMPENVKKKVKNVKSSNDISSTSTS